MELIKYFYLTVQVFKLILKYSSYHFIPNESFNASIKNPP